jgi:predicted amidophosphoribosyltransferase
MRGQRKRYCPRCAERMRNTAVRCRYCGTRALPARYYAVGLVVAVAVFIVLVYYLS